MPKRKSLKERMANVLSASDKNFLKNHGEKYTLGFLTQKLGKSRDLIDKELKKLGITPLSPTPLSAINVEEEKPVYNLIEQKVVEQIEEQVVEQVEEQTAIEVKIKTAKTTKKAFTEEEIEYIKKNISTKSVKKIAQELNHSRYKVKILMVKLGLSIKPFGFTEEEIEYIKKNSSIKSIKKIAQELGYSMFKVRSLMVKLGLNTKALGLTDEDKEFIRKNHKKFFLIEFAQKLNRNTKIISNFCKSEGLQIKNREIAFTKSELEYIKENNGKIPRKEIAATLGRKPDAIKYVVAKYKWFLSPEESKERKRRWIIENLSPPVPWSPVEEAFVRYNFGKMPYIEMAEILKTKTKRQISDYCVKNGLKVTPEMMTKNRMRARELNKMKRENMLKYN